MNKELFIKYLDNFKKYSDWENKLCKLGINFWEQPEIQNLLVSYLDLLSHCCKDEYDNIGYFIYEQDFGEDSDKYYITEADGTEIKNKTVEDLWNYLVKLHPEIKEESVKHGHWVEGCSCSVCHNYTEDADGDIIISNTPYCPNCGAKMDEDE